MRWTAPCRPRPAALRWRHYTENYEKIRIMECLTLTSCMAPNMDFLCRALGDYLASRLPLLVQVRLDLPWQERQRLFEAGQIQLCWICGLPYVRLKDRAPERYHLIAAPVMAGSRYRGEPVYYSDVVVRSESPFRSLDDLQGASWAYNEPGSHSGYGVVRYALARQGRSLDFFGRVVESGAHQVSLQMILKGEVDASTIDSTVLELELAQNPALAARLRVIATFGPSPIPPWVASAELDRELQLHLRETLTAMGTVAEGREILKQAGLARFAPVEDRDYDPIRQMARIAFGTAG